MVAPAPALFALIFLAVAANASAAGVAQGPALTNRSAGQKTYGEPPTISTHQPPTSHKCKTGQTCTTRLLPGYNCSKDPEGNCTHWCIPKGITTTTSSPTTPAPSWCAVVPDGYTYTPFGGISLLIGGHTLCCPSTWLKAPGDGSRCNATTADGVSCFLWGNRVKFKNDPRPCPSLTALYTRNVSSAMQWTDCTNTEPTANGGVRCSGPSTKWGENFAHSLDTIEESGTLRGIEFKFTDTPTQAMVGLEHGVKDDHQTWDNTSYAHFTMYKYYSEKASWLKYFEQNESYGAHKMLAPDYSTTTFQLFINSDNFVEYFMNGTKFYTSRNAIAFPVFVDFLVEPSTPGGVQGGVASMKWLQCTGMSAGLPAGECAAWIDLFDATGGTKWAHCGGSRLDPCGCRYENSGPGPVIRGVNCSAGDQQHILKL